MRPEKEPSFRSSGPLRRPSTKTSSPSSLMSGPLGFYCMRSWPSDRCRTQVSEGKKNKKNNLEYTPATPFCCYPPSDHHPFFFLCSHEQLPGGAANPAGLPDALPTQLSKGDLRHYDGVLEGERAWAAHLWDTAVEAGGLLWPGCYLLRWRQSLLAAASLTTSCQQHLLFS